MEIGGDFSGAKKVTVFHFLPNINDLKLIKKCVCVCVFNHLWSRLGCFSYPRKIEYSFKK